MCLIHMKYFLMKYVCLTTIITTLVSLNCVQSVTVELNVKAKYYHMLCVCRKQCRVKDINNHGIIFWDIVWALKRARIFWVGGKLLNRRIRTEYGPGA